MTKPRPLVVEIEHDALEGVWYILSSDIPGLHAEAASFDELVAVIADVAPHLIGANMAQLVGGAPSLPISITHTVNVGQGRAA